MAEASEKDIAMAEAKEMNVSLVCVLIDVRVPIDRDSVALVDGVLYLALRFA